MQVLQGAEEDRVDRPAGRREPDRHAAARLVGLLGLEGDELGRQ